MNTPVVAALSDPIIAAAIMLVATVFLLLCYCRLVLDASPVMASIRVRADHEPGRRVAGPHGRGRHDVPHRHYR